MEVYVVKLKDFNVFYNNIIHLFKSKEKAYEDFEELKTKAIKDYGVKDLLNEKGFRITITSNYVSFYTEDFKIEVEIEIHKQELKD